MSVIPSYIKNLTIFALPLLLSGCVFHDYPAPRVEGTLSDAGKPLAGIIVTLTNYDQPIATTQTDSHGHFSLAPQGNWHLFIPIGPQDRIERWTLIANDLQGQKRSIYSGGSFGGPFSGYSRGDRISLICDLSPAARKTQRFSEAQACEPSLVKTP